MLSRVTTGEPITADTFNAMVDAINGLRVNGSSGIRATGDAFSGFTIAGQRQALVQHQTESGKEIIGYIKLFRGDLTGEYDAGKWMYASNQDGWTAFASHGSGTLCVLMGKMPNPYGVGTGNATTPPSDRKRRKDYVIASIGLPVLTLSGSVSGDGVFVPDSRYPGEGGGTFETIGMDEWTLMRGGGCPENRPVGSDDDFKARNAWATLTNGHYMKLTAGGHLIPREGLVVHPNGIVDVDDVCEEDEEHPEDIPPCDDHPGGGGGVDGSTDGGVSGGGGSGDGNGVPGEGDGTPANPCPPTDNGGGETPPPPPDDFPPWWL